MPQDSMQVVICRILATLYHGLRTGGRPDPIAFGPAACHVGAAYWEGVEFLEEGRPVRRAVRLPMEAGEPSAAITALFGLL